MPEEFLPDWKGIEESQIWQEQILPWLKMTYQESLEFRSGQGKGPFPVGSGQMTQQEFDWWCGWCAACKKIMDTPAEMNSAEIDARAQEQKDAKLVQSQQRAQSARRSGF